MQQLKRFGMLQNSVLQHLPFIRGSTFTDLALNTACNDVLAVGEGKAREGVHKIVIVITDGRSRYYKDTLIEAAACRSDGVSLIAVGVGVSSDYQKLCENLF